MHNIVLIGKHDVFSPRFFDSVISGVPCASILFLKNLNPIIFICKRPNVADGIIGRSVIHANTLPIRKGLPLD